MVTKGFCCKLNTKVIGNNVIELKGFCNQRQVQKGQKVTKRAIPVNWM
jgi:hypothetical protein